jgi:hypothetical protein
VQFSATPGGCTANLPPGPAKEIDASLDVVPKTDPKPEPEGKFEIESDKTEMKRIAERSTDPNSNSCKTLKGTKKLI